MVKQGRDLIWLPLARQRLQKIYRYYYRVAGIEIAKRRVDRLVYCVGQLSIYPELGFVEPELADKFGEYHTLIVGDYKIVYYSENEIIYIVTLFDCRQDPRKLKISIL